MTFFALTAVIPCAADPGSKVTTLPSAVNLAINASFEETPGKFSGWYPVGVVAAENANAVEIVQDVARTGKKSLNITPGPAGHVAGIEYYPSHNGEERDRKAESNGGVRGVRTYAARLEADTQSVHAAVWVRAQPDTQVHAAVVWLTHKNRKLPEEVGRVTVEKPTDHRDGWDLYRIDADRPADGYRACLSIETDSMKPFYIDDVSFMCRHEEQTLLLVDQLGYEPASRTKRAVLQTSSPRNGVPKATILDQQTNEPVMSVAWQSKGYLPAWDRYHWTADFSDLTKPGRYVVTIDDRAGRVRSRPFAVRDNVVIAATAKLAYQFYYCQRCGIEIPGVHAACHLDDAKLPDGSYKDLTGGWHDAGDYNKYNGLTPEAVQMLGYAWHCKPALFEQIDDNGNGIADIVDEADWGARFLEKMLDHQRLELLESVYSGYRYWGPPEKETDNHPGTGDERPVRPGQGDASHCAAAFAWTGLALAGSRDKPAAKRGRDWIDLAKKLHEKYEGGVETLIALLAATDDPRYRSALDRRIDQLVKDAANASPDQFRELTLFAREFPDDARIATIKPLAARRVAELEALCDERFGVARRRDQSGALVYCTPYEHVNDWSIGQTSYLLDAAIDGLLADSLGEPRGRTIAENQVHWILGCNPAGLSLMEGIGSRHVPLVHHRYNAIAGNRRGSVSGALLNGLIRAWPHVDRPWYDWAAEPNPDYRSNEPWLLHNNRWLMLISLW